MAKKSAIEIKQDHILTIIKNNPRDKAALFIYQNGYTRNIDNAYDLVDKMNKRSNK